MISIIICSANELLLNNIKVNIEDTVGEAYEIISFDNSKGEKGICEIYNRGIEQAKFDILCFIHEDIIIHTKNWGSILIDIFKDKNIGLVGMAGASYKSLTPSGFQFSGDPQLDLNYCHVRQRFKLTKQVERYFHFNPTNERLPSVACVDGVWLCASREALNFYRFDQALLKGFHGYDLDLSFGLIRKYKIVVAFDILITHFSEGNFDKKWLTEILKVHKKWSHLLPINLVDLPDRKVFLIEKRSFRELFGKMKAWDFSTFDMVKVALASNSSIVVASYKLKFKVFFSAVGYLFK